MRGFYARFYGPREGVKTALWHRHLKKLKDPLVRVPRCLASSRRRRTLLVAEQKGEPMGAFFSRSPSDLELATETAAKALANWHRLTPPPEAPLLNSGAGQLQAAARTVDVLLEDSAIGAGDLASELTRAIPPANGPALLHGDFYYDQVLLRHERACFLDLDELGVGDPVRDVANFCAHLRLLEVRGEISVADPVCERFVETYQSAAGRRIPRSRLAWHSSAALLKLAVLPFRRLDPEWPRQLKLILELARSEARGVSC